MLQLLGTHPVMGHMFIPMAFFRKWSTFKLLVVCCLRDAMGLHALTVVNYLFANSYLS